MPAAEHVVRSVIYPLGQADTHVHNMRLTEERLEGVGAGHWRQSDPRWVQTGRTRGCDVVERAVRILVFSNLLVLL